MTAFVRPGEESLKNFPFNDFRTRNFTSHAQAFGREPNTLPKLCNCLIQKNFGSPGRIRTSNISVNSRGCETLNALFGVAYDRTTLNPDPQVGNFGQPNERRKAVD